MPEKVPEIEAGGDVVSTTTCSTSPPTSNAASSSTRTDTSKNGKITDKTISCVSCRKRKLRCDRSKPSCGTCERLRHECEYPERRKNLGSKRRNVKELEARLARVETKVILEVPPSSTTQQSTFSFMSDDGNAFRDLSAPQFQYDEPLGTGQQGFEFQSAVPSLVIEDPISQELISLGLQEPLPPQDMINELDELYFEKFHGIMPIMHKYRYFASLDRAPHMRPPVCLRYAMWTMAAYLSDKYICYEDLLYERARRYLEAAEMKNYGETFITVYHAQAWGLVASYEASKTFFTRSWMSTGRMTRLTQMMGLHRLDGDGSDVKMVLPPASDWIELEERRRTFWCAFYSDRWASSGTGWPMTIDEKEILTNLPASEDSFERGIIQNSISLADALTPEGAPKVSTFGGVILATALFGHNFHHLHRMGPNERPRDPSTGEFWKRHRRMDNILSNTFLFLPSYLRMPEGLKDLNIVFLHMIVHTSAICLHQAAVITAERHMLDPATVRQGRARCLMAAQEITSILRLIGHVDPSRINLWMGFSFYVAAGVLLRDLNIEKDPHPQSLANLKFILATMNVVGTRHTLLRHFTAQLEFDIESRGISQESPSDIRNFTEINNTRYPDNVREQPGLSYLGRLPGMKLCHIMPPSDDTQGINGHFSRLPNFTPNNSGVVPCVTPAIQGGLIFRDSSPFANLDTENPFDSRGVPDVSVFSTDHMQFPLRQNKNTNNNPQSATKIHANGMTTLFSERSGGPMAEEKTQSFQNIQPTIDHDPFLGDIVWDSNLVEE